MRKDLWAVSAMEWTIHTLGGIFMKKWLAIITTLSMLASSMALSEVTPVFSVVAEDAVTDVQASEFLESYLKNYNTLSQLEAQVTFSGNQVLILCPVEMDQEGCVIDVREARWKVGGTALTTYQSGAHGDYELWNGLGYCLITAKSPGSVAVQCEGCSFSNQYFTLQVGEDGNFDGTVSYNEPEEPIVMWGDVNDDWEFTVSDVVAFQKWLTGDPDAKLDVWQACDFTNDGMLNALDLRIMKQAL